jgi:hypothetical protein
LSSTPIPPAEISEELLGKVVPGVAIYTEDQIGVTHEYDATVADLREMLRPLGLDITTERALNWGIANPIQAAHIDTIIELQQETDELRAQLVERDEVLEGTFPQDPRKRAAE